MNESEIDKTSFWWTGLCAICHPGGGPAEFDRDGELYYDVTSDQFGYEKLGKTANDVTLDGDYAEINTSNGSLRAAPWNVTGVAEADCLFCHRADRTISDGKNMNWIWRTAALRAKDKLVDGNDEPVMAFAAAATAGQGWFTTFELAATPPGAPPMAAKLGVDYQPGLDNGTLYQQSGNLYVSMGTVAGTPKDFACWGCHATPDIKKRGREWFNPDTDVHYAGFNHLADGDAGNDIEAADSIACARCHPASMTGMDLNHNIAKGNANLGSVRNDTDYVGFRTCRDCHLATSADRDPDAPVPPQTTVHSARHLGIMSCEACHIPYKEDAADLVVDNSVTGATVGYPTGSFLSADPLDPANGDKSRWYPSFVMKKDRDGTSRVFPVKLLLSVWWGDWDQNGTPADLSDDVIKPIALWRVRQAVAGLAPADNKVNTEAEILTYINALTANDSYGQPFAARPVLVKGGKVWYANGAVLGEFEYEGTGIKTESSHPFAVSHNVRSGATAWGADGNCSDCHSANSPFFDRKVLIDPFDTEGNPVYKTVREILGFGP